MKDIFSDLYDRVLSFFTTQSSDDTKIAAKNRLRTVLMQDRVGFSERAMQMLKDDLIEENFKIEEAEVKNISNDGKSKEITVIGDDLISLTSKAYTYQINADDNLQIKSQKYLEVNPWKEFWS